MKKIKQLLVIILFIVSVFKITSCTKVDMGPVLVGLNNLKNQNDSLLILTKKLQTSLDSVKSQVSQNTSLLNTINSKVTSLQTSVAALITSVNILNTKLDSVNINITVVQQQLTTLFKQYQSLSSQISNVFASISNHLDSLSYQNAINTTLLNKLQTEYLTTQIKVDSILLQIQINNQLLTTDTSNISLIQSQLIVLTSQYNNVITLLNQLITLINNQSVLTSLSNGLVAYYPFTGNANDSSGNNHNGTIFGASLTTDRFGNSNSAYLFNGSNNYIQIPNSSSFNLQDSVSFSAWINTTNTALGQRILSKLNEGTSIGWVLDFSTGIPQAYEIRCVLGGANTLTTIPYSTAVLTQNNTWYQITVTYDLTNVKIYVNGQLNTTKSLTSMTPAYLANLIIGGPTNLNPGGGFFNGKLDEIRIYNRPLTQTEITYLAAH